MSSTPPENPYGQQPPPPPQAPYGQQPYGQQPYYNQAPVAPTTNGLAIAALITGLLIGPVGLILGLIAVSQINKSNGTQKGKGLAIAGIVLGALSVVWIVLLIIAAVSNGSTSG